MTEYVLCEFTVSCLFLSEPVIIAMINQIAYYVCSIEMQFNSFECLWYEFWLMQSPH